MYSMLADIGEFFRTYWLIFVLLILIIALYVFSFYRRKKYTEQTQNMLNTLRPGDKIKTYSGIYGTIVSIKETTDGKVILLEMGEGSKISYTTIDANAIYGVDRKEDVVYDKEGNIIENDSKKEEKTVKSEEKTEEATAKKEDPKDVKKEAGEERKDEPKNKEVKTEESKTVSKKKSEQKTNKE